MNENEPLFDIDVVDAPTPPSRTPLRLALIACAAASSATFLMAWHLDVTTSPLFAPVRAAAARLLPPPHAPVAVAVVEPVPQPMPEPPPVEAPAAPVKMKSKAKPAAPRESGVRAVIKEGAFVLERTGAAPVVQAKVPVLVRAANSREELRPAVDHDEIELVMRDRSAAFRGCYESALRSDNALAGSFEVKFTIDPLGAVKQASVKTPTAAKAPAAAGLSRCVRDVLKRTRFAPTSAPTSVKRTLTFRREASNAPTAT